MTNLIRVALQHELADINGSLGRADKAKVIEAICYDPEYLHESRISDQGLMEGLPNEPENWWQG